MGDIPRGDPDATPRIGKRSEAKRERPIFQERREDWSVVVTPITGVSHSRSGVSFEVQAEFTGRILESFETARRSPSRRRETWHTPDAEAATRTARAVCDLLRAGDRDVFIPEVAHELGFEARAAGWPERPA